MSTSTDLEWSVTNFSKIDAKFTSFYYFVDKHTAVSTKLHMQESSEKMLYAPNTTLTAKDGRDIFEI
jgi:hypothetical protein